MYVNQDLLQGRSFRLQIPHSSRLPASTSKTYLIQATDAGATTSGSMAYTVNDTDAMVGKRKVFDRAVDVALAIRQPPAVGRHDQHGAYAGPERRSGIGNSEGHNPSRHRIEAQVGTYERLTDHLAQLRVDEKEVNIRNSYQGKFTTAFVLECLKP